MRTVAIATLSILVFGSHALFAGPKKQIIDVVHSTLEFTVESFLIDTEGTFKVWEGAVMLDWDNIENSSVEVVIQADSIDTRIARRDEHLKTADFLDVATYPTITFKSARVQRTGDKTFNLTGKLTLHGVTREITMPVTVDRLQDDHSKFRGDVTLSRSSFGIDYNSRLNPIDDAIKVSIVVHIERPAQVGGSRPEGLAPLQLPPTTVMLEDPMLR